LQELLVVDEHGCRGPLESWAAGGRRNRAARAVSPKGSSEGGGRTALGQCPGRGPLAPAGRRPFARWLCVDRERSRVAGFLVEWAYSAALW
jgi:hypothetical protein